MENRQRLRDYAETRQTSGAATNAVMLTREAALYLYHQ
jgi:hypothetical protein